MEEPTEVWTPQKHRVEAEQAVAYSHLADDPDIRSVPHFLYALTHAVLALSEDQAPRGKRTTWPDVAQTFLLLAAIVAVVWLVTR